MCLYIVMHIFVLSMSFANFTCMQWQSKSSIDSRKKHLLTWGVWHLDIVTMQSVQMIFLSLEFWMISFYFNILFQLSLFYHQIFPLFLGLLFSLLLLLLLFDKPIILFLRCINLFGIFSLTSTFWLGGFLMGVLKTKEKVQ